MVNPSKISLTVFFPCFNEEGNVAGLVRGAFEILPGITDDFEVIVVDDGSRDETAGIVETLQTRYPSLRLVRHSANRGYGAALSSGFQAARKDWIFFADGDRQFDLEELPRLLERRRGVSVVLGYRLNRSDPFIRTVNSWLWKTLIRILFGVRARDPNCGFKLFRREWVQALRLESQGAFVNAELLISLKRDGAAFEEVGIRHHPRLAGRPTGARLSVIAQALKELIFLGPRLRRRRIPI